MAGIQGLLFLSLTLASFASAQFRLSVGVKAGVPLTSPFEEGRSVSVYDPSDPGGIHVIRPNGSADTSSKNYLVGPMIELKLPWRLSVESNALFRPLDATGGPQGLASFLLGYATADIHATTWEFPLLRNIIFRRSFGISIGLMIRAMRRTLYFPPNRTKSSSWSDFRFN